MRYRREPGPRLDQSIMARLDRLYKATRIKANDFDGRVYELMNTMPPASAIRAIDRFQAKLSDDVRNVSALMTSMLRQVWGFRQVWEWHRKINISFPLVPRLNWLIFRRRTKDLARDRMMEGIQGTMMAHEVVPITTGGTTSRGGRPLTSLLLVASRSSSPQADSQPVCPSNSSCLN